MGRDEAAFADADAAAGVPDRLWDGPGDATVAAEESCTFAACVTKESKID